VYKTHTIADVEITTVNQLPKPQRQTN